MKAKESFKLIPELVPEPLWGRSASQMFKGNAIWRKRIRGDAMARSGSQCAICGVRGVTLQCHELFTYEKNTATLAGFEMHCRGCDAIVHHGHFKSLLDEGVISRQDYEKAMAHMCRVNGCTRSTADEIIADAFKLWRQRSSRDWKIEVDPKLLEAYPELAALREFNPDPRKYAPRLAIPSGLKFAIRIKDGRLVKDYDPDAFSCRGHIIVTRSVNEARIFDTENDALRFCARPNRKNLHPFKQAFPIAVVQFREEGR